MRTHVSLRNIKDWIAVVADDILKIGGGGQGNTKDTKPRPGGDFLRKKTPQISPVSQI